MMGRQGIVFSTAVAVALVALVAGGADAPGRLLLAAGLPGPAAAVLSDPMWRAVALERAGDHEAAAALFARAGDPYNHGVSAARAGDYAAALAAFDAVLSADPDDAAARANYDLVAALFAGTRFDPAVVLIEDRVGPTLAAETGQGRARAGSTGDDVTNPQSGFAMPELVSTGLRRASQVFDAQHVAANDRWLATLTDAPGEYLAARLAAEQKQRAASGRALPPAEDPE